MARVEVADIAPLEPKRTPESDATDSPPVVVVEVTASVPVAIKFATLRLPENSPLPANVLVADADVATNADAVEVAVEVIAPLLVMPFTVSEPRLATLAKRLVELAVVENRFVLVALPKIALTRFALVTYKLVEVAFVVVELVAIKLPIKVFEPILILPKPLPIEPEVRVPTVARVEAEVRAGNEAKLPADVSPARVVMFGSDVVATRTAMAVVDALEVVKYRLFAPSAKAFVVVPAKVLANNEFE